MKSPTACLSTACARFRRDWGIFDRDPDSGRVFQCSLCCDLLTPVSKKRLEGI
jgi:hypothetical protein